MSLFERISSIYNSPSHREDIDYTKLITLEAKKGVFLLLSQLSGSVDLHKWFSGVRDDFLLLHPDYIHCSHSAQTFPHDSSPNHHPLPDFFKYLGQPSTESVAFLDFLECAFKNDASPKENDLILSINLILEKNDCPYRLSKFVWNPPWPTLMRSVEHEVKTYPFIYLAQAPIVDDHAIKPVLELFADSEFNEPNKSLSKALKRHKNGDYSGCVTSCATAVEESIKVISKKNGWDVKCGGVGKSTQAFLRQSNLPIKLKVIADFIAERRNNVGDVHENNHGATTEADARFLIGLSSAFIVFLSSEIQ